MLEQLEVLDLPEQAIARLHLTVPRSEMRHVMGPARQEVFAVVAEQGIATSGPWFCHHFRIDPQLFDFEVSLPVASAVNASGRVQPGVRSAMRVARAIYRGPYEGLGSAWPEFDAWIAAQGHKAGTELWEHYVSGPESGSDPQQWRTEFWRALVAQ